MKLKYFFGLAAISLLLTSCVALDGGEEVLDDMTGDEVNPLTYDLPSVDAEVDMSEVAFSDLFTVDGLQAAADECGTDYEDGYFEDLYVQLEDETVYQYEFTYDGETQGSGVYTLNVVANVPGYANLSAFEADFEVCALGGLYPVDMNSNWLAFATSCGGGYNDGSDLPIGCEEIKDDLDFALN